MPVGVVQDVPKDLCHPARVSADPDRGELRGNEVGACRRSLRISWSTTSSRSTSSSLSRKPPSLALARVSRSSTRKCMREVSSERISVSSCQVSPDGSAAATSTPARRVATGLRSSWLASERNRRCARSRGLQPFQHLVHRLRQGLDFVVGVRNVDSFVQMRCRRCGRPVRGSFRLVAGTAPRAARPRPPTTTSSTGAAPSRYQETVRIYPPVFALPAPQPLCSPRLRSAFRR